jgi:hypothetical protein
MGPPLVGGMNCDEGGIMVVVAENLQWGQLSHSKKDLS